MIHRIRGKLCALIAIIALSLCACADDSSGAPWQIHERGPDHAAGDAGADEDANESTELVGSTWEYVAVRGDVHMQIIRVTFREDGRLDVTKFSRHCCSENTDEELIFEDTGTYEVDGRRVELRLNEWANQPESDDQIKNFALMFGTLDGALERRVFQEREALDARVWPSKLLVATDPTGATFESAWTSWRWEDGQRSIVHAVRGTLTFEQPLTPDERRCQMELDIEVQTTQAQDSTSLQMDCHIEQAGDGSVYRVVANGYAPEDPAATIDKWRATLRDTGIMDGREGGFQYLAEQSAFPVLYFAEAGDSVLSPPGYMLGGGTFKMVEVE